MSSEGPLPSSANSHDHAEPPARGRRDQAAPAEPLATTSAARLAAAEQTAGALTGVYAPDELAALREDWPA